MTREVTISSSSLLLIYLVLLDEEVVEGKEASDNPKEGGRKGKGPNKGVEVFGEITRCVTTTSTLTGPSSPR